MFQIGGTIMKNLSIVFMITIVLGMAGCDMGNTPQPQPSGLTGPFLSFHDYKPLFDYCLEQWTEQGGHSDYSFDVAGYECRPNTPKGTLKYNLPPDVKFCAHVTVEDDRIVSIENIEPDERSSISMGEVSFQDVGAYTWGAIPDIFDKILSISREEASSPYAYNWVVGVNDNGVLSEIDISIYTFDPFSYPDLEPLSSVLLYRVHFYIRNFQVNVPKLLEKWTKQGILNYSFDVAGYEYEPMIPYKYGGALLYSVPPEAKFCAHVTVTDDSIVSIENIEPDKRSSISIVSPLDERWYNLSLSPDEGELGAYTWGTIPDIFNKIFSIVTEKASSPYAYEWRQTYDKEYGFLNYLAIEICTLEDTETLIFDDLTKNPPSLILVPGKRRGILLHKALFYIKNFQVTENAPQ
jgi:hypothetical protein